MKKYLLLFFVVLAWNCLVHAENKLPKVYLNRISIVVDDVTFKGILKSPFITKKFANVDARFPEFSQPNDTSSILYVLGKNTIIVILNSKNPYGLKEGNIGIGFGVEEVKGVKKMFDFYDSIYLLKPIASLEMDSITIAGKRTASEYILGIYNTVENAALACHVTEYQPDLLQTLFRKNFQSKPIKRSDVLKKRYNPDKLLKDIAEINLEISQKETVAFVEALKRLDFSVSEKNNAFVAKGNDIVIRIKTTESLMPKLQLKLILNQSKDGNYNLNNSKLDFGGNYASWNFY